MARVAEVDGVWVKAALKKLERQDLSAENLLKEAGLSRAMVTTLDQRLPLKNNDRFYELAAQATGNDLFGFQTGRDTDPGFFGLLAYLGLSSETLEDAIRNHIEFLGVFVDGYRLQLNICGTNAELLYSSEAPGAHLARQANEAGMAALISVYRYGTGRVLRPKEVHFTHVRKTVPGEMTRFFNCPVHFGSDRHGAVLGVDDLKTPLVRSDEYLLSFLKKVAVSILQKRTPAQSSFLSRVEEAVLSGLKEGAASAQDIARTLALSERTFARRLGEQGTTFKAVLEGVRRELATEYLRNSGLSLPEIAFLLGYSDTPAFNRAFKRWTGTTPGRFV